MQGIVQGTSHVTCTLYSMPALHPVISCLILTTGPCYSIPEIVQNGSHAHNHNVDIVSTISQARGQGLRVISSAQVSAAAGTETEHLSRSFWIHGPWSFFFSNMKHIYFECVKTYPPGMRRPVLIMNTLCSGVGRMCTHSSSVSQEGQHGHFWLDDSSSCRNVPCIAWYFVSLVLAHSMLIVPFLFVAP